jgi:hypothetical protein
MELSINERYVKPGKFPISETIPVDGSFQLKVVGYDELYEFTCVKVEKKTNNDGTYDEVYILKYQP